MVAELRCSTTSAEIAEYMQKVREQSSELLVEEWNLLSLACKKAFDSRRAAWRVITSTEQKEKFKDKEELVLHAREYVARHLAEVATGETKSKAGEDACVAYAEAIKITEKDLVMAHPIRLAMALSSLDDVSVVAQRQIPIDQTVQKTVEMPVTRTKEKTQHVVNTHVQHAVNTVEAEKPIINETINQVTKHVEIPQLQIVDVPGSQTQEETVEVIQPVPQDRMSDHVVQQTVKELRMSEVHDRNRSDKNRWREKQRFEAKQYPQDGQERADLTNQRHVLAIRTVQKTVEVPRVQYIDKVADIPVDVQRQESTNQALQHDIDEVGHITVPTHNVTPTIPDTDDLCLDETADEDRLEQENKKRKLPTPAEAVSESRANESDFDRFDDLVLPSPEGKTLFMNIASDDEAKDGPEKEQEMTRSLVQAGESMLMDETDARSPGREMVQVIHAEWSQELREVRRKFADDVASEMTDVKNDLAHVRELLGVLVRRERCAQTKTEIAARRLDRMEREQTEADDAEHEANLQEALANQSKAVKVVVDKWFVDKGYGFGKAPKGEIVFIHASAVQGAEVLTIGTDAWVQVVNDDARAQGEYRAKRAWGRNAWKAERDKENANKVAQQVWRAATLTAELAAQLERKLPWCATSHRGLTSSPGTLRRPTWGQVAHTPRPQ